MDLSGSPPATRVEAAALTGRRRLLRRPPAAGGRPRRWFLGVLDLESECAPGHGTRPMARVFDEDGSVVEW